MFKSSVLLRVAIWLLLGCSLMAPVWLLYEYYQFVQSRPDHGFNSQLIRITVLVVLNLFFAITVATIGLLYLWVRLARSLPDLQGWHLQHPASEFSATDAGPEYTFEDYLHQEARVFEELQGLIQGSWKTDASGAFSRYHPGSVCNPDIVVDRNWNRSHVLEANDPVGGVLLIHGLSDAPYSLRVLGERLHREGYTVVWLRVPGHGTCPSALASIAWQDWVSAVKVAMRGLRERVTGNRPLVIAGYSNGGALSVKYALSALNDSTLPRPDAILLFSPMIGINPLARMTRLYHTVALVSGNHKAQWSSIEAEVDPFKFSSWPMNANVQAWRVTQLVEKELASLEKSNRMHEMPPVLAMQSIVDSTVEVPKLITALFDRLKSYDSELFLFDIDRFSKLENLFNRSFEQKIFPKLSRNDLPYTLSLLTNASPESRRLVVRTRAGEQWSEKETQLEWPGELVSLSHIAVPFPPEDPIYGSTDGTVDSGLPLGTLSMRAEPSALMLSTALFVRSRYNPFYSFMEDRIVSWLQRVIS